MKVIKSNTYNIISSEPFEIPFPVVFELLSGNTLLVEYTISEAGVVDYSFNPNANEKILTSIRRPLTLSDIYFLFSSRIFPDKTPYTAIEMERFEIEEYQQYAIIRKTRGMLPGDKYWFRFEGEYINYKTALHENRAYYENSYKKYLESIETASAAAVAEEAEIQEETTETLAEPLQPEMSKVDVDIMRDDMVNSLMSSLSNELKIQESIDPPEIVSDEKMSDDAIAVLLAASFASEPPVETTAAPAEVSESASSEKISDDAIAALFAQNQ
ncbi:MAG: hypothetical protein LBC82_04575 [Oscillospiraceae bacterium]|jgi:hypothetical protein|nr:hypothetical protein [Oscillospiraceae bacterium]